MSLPVARGQPAVAQVRLGNALTQRIDVQATRRRSRARARTASHARSAASDDDDRAGRHFVQRRSMMSLSR